MNELEKNAFEVVRQIVLCFGFLPLLMGGYFIYVSYFNQTPQHNNLTVINGVYREYDQALGNRSTDSIYLKESGGTPYEVPYFQDNPSKRSAFLKDVKEGQYITLWTYKHSSINTVLAIKSNNKTYLSYKNSSDYDKAATNQGKIFGIGLMLLSGIFLSFYCGRFKKSKSPKFT